MAADMDKDKAPSGCWLNRRLMHACTTIVGFTVHLQTKEGEVFEGIFETFSPEFTICLLLAVKIDPKSSRKDCLYDALRGGSKAHQKLFFDLKDIVRISVVDIDLNYATKSSSSKLATDADISGYDSNKSTERKHFECWQDEDDGGAGTDSLQALETLDANEDDIQKKAGWDAQDMFNYNERVHKVATTYDDKLTDYTLPLPNNNSKEWRKRSERAAAIAKEIEGNIKSQIRAAKEDGSDCEEEKFSAVIRPVPNRLSSSSAARNKSAGPNDNANESNKQIASAGQKATEASNQQQQQQQQSPAQHHSNQNQPHQSHQSHQQNQSHHPSHQHQSHPHQLHRGGPQMFRSLKDDKGDDETNKYPMHRQMPNRMNPGNQNGTHKNFQRPRFDRSAKMDSLKSFGTRLNIGPSPKHPQTQGTGQNIQSQIQNVPNQQNQSKQASLQPHPMNKQQQSPLQAHPRQSPQQHQQQQQHHQPHQQTQQSSQQPPIQSQLPNTQQSNQQLQQHTPAQSQPIPQAQPSQLSQQQQQPAAQQQSTRAQAPQQSSQQQQARQQQQPVSTTQAQQQQQQQQPQPPQTQSQTQITITTASPTTSTTTVNTSIASERSDASSQAKDHQSELARKSKLNPHAKEFVYKPRSPAASLGAQTYGANQATPSAASSIDPSNSSPMSQAPHGPYYQQVPMFPHGLSPHQPHHAAQFMPNHTHPHFQNQMHYMSPVPPHFAPQMPQRYIRGNIPGYHHRGDHNTVRPDYSQSPMMASTNTGQPFVPSPAGPAHPMNAYAPPPQQPMIYGAPPPQSIYGVSTNWWLDMAGQILPQ